MGACVAILMQRHNHDTLLLQCLRTPSSDVERPDSGDISSDDWHRMVEVALRHGVAPLLYQRFKAEAEGRTPPPPVVQKLREAYFSVATRNTKLYHELGSVVRELETKDVPVVLLKGAHLAEVVYGNIALRPMADADVLVRKDDLPRAVDGLLEMGCLASRHVCIEAELATNHDLPMFLSPDGLHLEVHWTLERPTSPFAIDLEGVWWRAQRAVIAGTDTSVLSPEDLLLHLCLHACFHHRFAMGLQPLCDIAATLEHYGEAVDWGQLVQRARQWRVQRGVYLVFRLARDLLCASVPDQVLETLDPGDLAPGLAEWAREEVFRREPRRVAMTENVARVLTAQTLRSKMALLVEHLFPSREFMATRYPVSSSRWLPVYYLVRVWDLVKRYGCTVWRHWRGDEDAVATHERVDRGNTLVDWLSLG